MEFSIQSAIRFGWETFKKRPGIFIVSSLVVAAVYVVAGLIAGLLDAATGSSPEQPGLFGSIVDLVVGTLVSVGVTNFYLKAHDNVETVSLESLWYPQPFWRYLAATILMGLGIVLGFFLLIVPGIILLLMWLFATFIVVDQGKGPIVSLGESRRITSGYRWKLLGFILVLALINIAGIIALVVGLLVTIPVTTLAFTHAYRILGGRPVQADASLTPRPAAA